MTDDLPTDSDRPPITQLKSRQRRVLGVLVEKAFTTPEYYPLTLKAVAAGCNQKSNRAPVVQFSQDDVADVLEQLREMGLVAVVHTESGRTERYRHYVRRRFTLTEPQIAILTELLLRGRQQLGELRSRASRMVVIESLEQLRNELSGLMQMNLVSSGGPVERRGIEVDHCLYTDKEQQNFAASPMESPAASPAESPNPPSQPAAAAVPQEWHTLKPQVEQLLGTQQDMQEIVNRLQETVDQLRRDVDDLKRDLGV